jgi:hypothetical protein
VHLVDFIIRIYNDARSYERQTLSTRVDVIVNILGTLRYKLELVFYIDKTVKITNSVKTGRTGCFVLNAVYILYMLLVSL